MPRRIFNLTLLAVAKSLVYCRPIFCLYSQLILVAVREMYYAMYATNRQTNRFRFEAEFVGIAKVLPFADWKFLLRLLRQFAKYTRTVFG